MSDQSKGWECEAYGPDFPRELGDLCFFDPTERCTAEDQCHSRMNDQRQKMFRRINELAAAGDPDFEYLSDEFDNPSQLLNGNDDSKGR